MPLRAALVGLKVVDFSNVPTGVQVSQLFADFGAEVIHVEPSGGSPLRAEAAWPFWARGKRSIQLDLHDPADLAVAKHLAGGADVVIETFRPGVAERLGLGYKEMSHSNPGLVYGSISGFGRKGPLQVRR
jgi:crotonobetainyl-CoA:carnitine CoA-transferase CaiB-like acyl-CoA transferase